MESEFNIVIAGVGGQGLVTLLRILAQAALLEGRDVKTSELHGLSQREGSVQAHVRIGKKIFSPLVQNSKADLIFGLEPVEALRIIDFLNKNTFSLINKKTIPYLGGPSGKEIFEKIKKLPGKVFLVDASEICQGQLGNEVLTGIFLLGFALSKSAIPLKSDSLIRAIKDIIPREFFEENKKAFQLGKVYEN